MKSAVRNINLKRLRDVKMSDIKILADNASHIRLKPWQWVVVCVAVALFAALVVWWAWPRPVEPDYPVVAVETVSTEDVSIYGDYVGRIRAQQFVEIRARVEG